MTSNKYPKILVVTSSTFNSYTGTGITLSNLFQDWPIDKIAIIHNDKFQTNRNICQNEYKRRNNEIINFDSQNKKRNSSAIYSLKLKTKVIANKIIGTEEILVYPKISDRLKKWLLDYKPKIIYIHFSSLRSLRFARMIINICNVPYVVHFMDDWYHFRYDSGILSSILRKAWKNETNEMITKAKICMGISEKMCGVYQKIFSKKFYPFFNAIDIHKWQENEVIKSTTKPYFDILYAGTINTKNINNLISMAKVCQSITNSGLSIRFNIFSFQPRLNSYRSSFSSFRNTILDEVPNGDEIISLLKETDLLFLPVDFNKESHKRMRYSMFTKIPAYMISGNPILFWGPDNIASIEYAKKYNWAYVVSRNDPTLLKNALLTLISDKHLREKISNKAKYIATKYHDSKVVRREFQELLKSMS